MKDVQIPREPSRSHLVCLHLGLEDDKQTCMAYPSAWNVCHHTRPVMAPKLEHQRKMCLTSNHVDCPVFQREKDRSLPRELRGRKKAGKTKHPRSFISPSEGF